MAKKSQKIVNKAAPNPEEKEQQLISLAMNLAERQLREGTASAAVIAHFLKLGSTNQKIEAELKESQATLAKSKAESIKMAENNKAVAEEAIAAMKRYQTKE